MTKLWFTLGLVGLGIAVYELLTPPSSIHTAHWDDNAWDYPRSRSGSGVVTDNKIVQRSCSMILTDEEFQALDMTERQIQAFLESHRSVLARIKIDGQPVSRIIFAAAQLYRISPRVALVTLQKEQGLVTRTSADSKVLSWAMGFHKPSTLRSQIEDGMRQYRRYLDSPEKFPRRLGVVNTIKDGAVVPSNPATVALYNYTPWLGVLCGGKAGVGGNGLFLALWARFFGTEPPPAEGRGALSNLQRRYKQCLNGKAKSPAAAAASSPLLMMDFIRSDGTVRSVAASTESVVLRSGDLPARSQTRSA